MKRRIPATLFACAWLLAAGAARPAEPGFPAVTAGGHASPERYPGMTLAWRDEFDGSRLDPARWSHETGTGENGLGTGEAQYYREQNLRVRDGYLVISARREAHGGREYTSSRIATRGKRQFGYGRIDIRAKLPAGQGLRPALWMLGATTDRAGWPAGGEIDIMEMVGGQGREDTVHGTLHWSQGRGHRYEGGSFTLPSGAFPDQFHVFSLLRDAESITWLVDGHRFFEVDISAPAFDAFREPFYLLACLAVGGRRPGEPGPDTAFPQHLVIDYIRVFE